MSAATLTHTDGVRSVLDHCRRQMLQHALLRGVAIVVITAAACTVAAVVPDYLLGLGAVMRGALLAAAVIVTGRAIWKHVVTPLRLIVPDDELGAAVDLSCPELRESLATLVSIERPTATSSEAGSAVMRGRLQKQVRARLELARATDVVDTRLTTRRVLLACGLVAALVLPSLLWPSNAALLAQRFLMPWENWATPTNLYFDVPDGNRTVARGSDVVFIAVPKWRTDAAGQRPERVELTMTAENGRIATLPMTFDEIAGHFAARLERIEEGFRYTVSGGGAQTEAFTLNVVDPPRIQAAVLTSTPPPYAGRAIETFDGVVGEMEVFDASRLEILLQFSKPVATAVLVWQRRDVPPASEIQIEDEKFDNMTGEIPPSAPRDGLAGSELPGVLSADGTAAVFELTADIGGDFVFDVVDEFGVRNSGEPDRTLIVVYDLPPQLEVRGIRNGDDFRPDDIVPIDCSVTDDIGVGNLELHYQKNGQAIRIEVPPHLDRGARSVQHAFRLNLADLDVAAGDTVSLRVRASDERPVPGPHEVWSNDFVIQISDDAAAVGADALDEEVQRIVDALKEIEQQLQHDKDEAYRLKNEVWREWNEQDRGQASQLSEKEQQQGRTLADMADEVAAHPLMQQQAQSLQSIGERVRDEIPQQLTAAAGAQKQQAERELQHAAEQLDEAGRELSDVIRDIEKIGQLEQELAELNRLALEAEQLADNAEQLDEDRQRPDNELPPDTSRAEWQQQLEQRQQQIEQERQQLDTEINDLLQQQQELRDAAQRAQQERLAELAEAARELAQQQQQLANAVRQEASDAARDARDIANRLQQARNEMQRLEQDLNRAGQSELAPQPEPLDEAIRDIRQGNFAQPQQAVQQAQQELNDAADRLQNAAEQPPKDDASDGAQQQAAREQAEQNQQLADRSTELSEELQDINDQLRTLREERNAAADANPDTAANAEANPDRDAQDGQDSGNDANSDTSSSEVGASRPENARGDGQSPGSGEQAAENSPASGQQQAGQQQNSQQQGGQQSEAARRMQSAAQDVLRRSEELANAAQEVSDNLQADSNVTRSATQSSQRAADRGQKAAGQAQAGQFSKAADEMRRAASDAEQAAGQLHDPQQQDRRSQLDGLSRQFSQLADATQMLQPSDAAQIAAQQQSQQQMAEQIGELPGQLADLAEKLDLPALGMQSQARQAQAGQQAADQAAQSSESATSELQQGSLQQAATSGQEAAAQLNQVAQMAQQAAGQPQNQQALVPSEVGERVTEALQNLQHAGQAAQPSSAEPADASQPGQQPGDGQQGEGQQGEGQSGEQPGQSEAGGEGDQSGQPGDGENAPGQGSNSSNGQPGDQPGNGQQPGQGNQPGLPGSGSRALSKAARALAQAAQESLPQQFSPGQLANGESASQSSQQAQGSDDVWDGRSPFANRTGVGDRNWGGLNEQLDTEVLSGADESLDSEYASLIRMYFRELARVSAEHRSPGE